MSLDSRDVTKGFLDVTEPLWWAEFDLPPSSTWKIRCDRGRTGRPCGYIPGINMKLPPHKNQSGKISKKKKNLVVFRSSRNDQKSCLRTNYGQFLRLCLSMKMKIYFEILSPLFIYLKPQEKICNLNFLPKSLWSKLFLKLL